MGKSCSNLWYIYAALLCFLVIALEHVSAQGDAPPKWTPTWTDRLKKDLLKGYDPSIRPSQHYNVTTVETSMTITHVEINEIKSTLSVYGWMKFIWNDTRLAWNPELYENKTNLYLNQSAIWHPTEESNVLVTVASNGEVQHAIALQKESKCSIQWEKWPFDTQHCKMLFSPWIEHEDMEIHVVLMKTWNDPKLTWDPANYGNLDVVRLDPTIVWRPDVVLYNNAGGSDNHHYGDTNVLVYSPGKVLWVPPTEYHAFCELNMRLWPFDYQKCIVKIGSWTFDGYKLNLTLGEDPQIETLVTNSEWKILKVVPVRHTTYYPCCTEPYIDVTYNVTLQRQSDTHRAIVVIPALVIIMFALSVFWLPLQAGERIVMNGIIALMITLFLIYFAQQLPAISGLTPLIVIFFSNTLLLTAFSTIISVLVINMTKTKHERNLPNILKRVAGVVGPFVGVGKKHFSFSDKGNVTIESSTDHEWCKFGLVLNRLSFLVYCVIFVICAFYTL
uniref:Neurotransmitter-gated ion-channel ligand-binding domain-containing protein n=1 Tax=Anopheles atroparvus TaxID=41427 RepID=A0A182IKT6_ANOAO